MLGSEMMAIDVVHDTQEVFRAILHCMSRPGTIKNIVEISKKMEQQGICQNSTFIIARTLLDAEVRFHVVGKKTESIEQYISAYTLSKVEELQAADYIFIMKDAQQQTISEVFNKVKKGTLLNPQQSATIVIETEMLSNEPHLMLTGPGIASTENVEITASEYWVKDRAEANIEYPLGVDMLLIDGDCNIMCLPRTTIIHDREVS
jgi:alpha-D-ribose 1-methylphosphonate 5-triphosphate synthase subunit PhnH